MEKKYQPTQFKTDFYFKANLNPINDFIKK